MQQEIKLDCSLSTKSYNKKPQVSYMKFHRTTLTPKELLEHLVSGYSSVGVFKNSVGNFNKNIRTQENFESIQYIAFDIDDETFSLEMNEFISLLTYKPTFSYTTFSDHETKYGYRLIYAFNKPIYGTYRYQGCYDALKYIIELDTYKGTYNHKSFTGKIDSAMRLTSQPIHGTKRDAKTYVSKIIYDYDEIFTDELFNKAGVNINLFDKPYISEIKLNGDYKLSDDFKKNFLDWEFYTDEKGREHKHRRVSDREFFQEYSGITGFEKYMPNFRNQDKTSYMIIKSFMNMNKVDFEIEEPFRVLDMLKTETNFLELKFRYGVEYVPAADFKRTGETIKKRTPVIYDGENRRWKLYGYGCLLRLMDNEGITLDKLVFYLFCLRMAIINNNDNLITREYLVEIATNIMSRDYRAMLEYHKNKQIKYYRKLVDDSISEEKDGKKRKKSAVNIKVKTNPDWCDVHNIKRMSVAAMGKSVHKYADIYKKIDWDAKPFWKDNRDLASRNTLKNFISLVLELETIGWTKPEHNQEYGKSVGEFEIPNCQGVKLCLTEFTGMDTWEPLEIKEMIMTPIRKEIQQYYKNVYNMVRLKSPITKEQFKEMCDFYKSRDYNLNVFIEKTGGSGFTFRLYEIISNSKFKKKRTIVNHRYNTKGVWKSILTPDDKKLKIKDLAQKVWDKFPDVPYGSINSWKYSKK